MSRSSQRSGWLLAALWIAWPAPGTRAAPEEPAAPAGAIQARDGPPEPPPDYRGAALPLENRETAGLLERARAEITAAEWGRAFAALDEALARATGPAARRRRGPTARARAETGERAAADAGFEEGARPEAPAGPARPRASPLSVAPAEECLTGDGIHYLPVVTGLRRQLLDLPPEARAVYASIYEAPARRAVEGARDLPPDRALRELRRAAERYPLTRAGAGAWSEVASRLVAAGRFHEAARALTIRLDLPFADPDARAGALVELAGARALAGDAPAAQEALAQLSRDHAAAAVALRGERVAGSDVAAHPLFRALLAGAGPAAAAAEPAWVAAGGGFEHDSFPAREPPPLGSRPRWIHPPGPEPDRQRPENQPAAGGPPSPVCHAGLVHVRRAGEVFAIDARSGKIVWTAAPGGLHREAIEVPDDRVQFSGGPPAPEPGLALHAWEDGSGKAVLLGIDGLSAPRAGRDGRTRWTANLLVAYDSRNGKLAWTASGGEDEEEGPLALAGTPVVAAGLVIAAGFQGDGVHVLAFTARGQRVWTRRLYILNQPPQAGWAFGGQAPLLAASGDTLVAGANGGLVCALEASTGELLWLSRYRNTGEEPNARQVSREPPVIAGGAAILSPADSDAVTAFDLASGAIRWERRQEASRQVLIGADGERAFVAGRKVAALRLADGETAWESEAVGPFAGSAVCAGGRLLVAARDGELQLLAAEDGKVLSRIRIADPRLPFPSSLELAVAGGTLVAASPARLFALEPRDASWAALGGAAGGRLFEKARLLRAEGRHEEALAAWKEIRRRGFPEHLRAEVEGGVVAAAEAAARAAKDPAFVREVLADASLVQDRRGKLSLRLLVASLLEARSPAEAAAAYRELAAEEEILVPAGNGFEVDVALHAANRLLALGSAGGEPVEAAAIAAILEDPAPAGASRAARRELANQAVRRPHLREASVALARLARAAELEGDLDQAAELLDSLLADRPELAADPLLAGKARQLAAARGREPVSPGLDAVLVPKDLPLQRRFWLASDEGFLAETPAASEPLPLLAVLAEGHLRLHDADGKLLHERPLPEFPDVSAVKLQFDASFEEPAVVRLDGNGLLLFTAAGLYSYRGRALAEGEGQGGVGRRADLKLAWASTWPHPLAGMPATGRWGRSGASRGAGNTFAEIVFARDGRPLILGRDGVLSAIDGRTGKLGFQLRPPGGGIPNSPPVLDGGRVLACFTNPAGIVAYRVPAASGRAGGTDGEGASSPLFIPSPADGFRQGGVAAGGLIAVYAGNGIEAVETATGRILWRRKDNAASLVHARALEVWLSLPDGALAIHSARSGELAATVPLPAGAGVIDVLEEPHAPQAAPGIAAAGEEARPAPTLLVLTRAAGRSRGMGEGAGGRGLHVVALGPRRETLFSVEVEKGLVTYGGARFTAGGGRCLFYNTEREPGKWSTRGALITPAGVVQEVFAAELTGKGTGQAPRLAVLRGGLGVGNADGFGWFGPQAGGAPPGGAGGLGAPPEGGEKR